MSKKDEVLEEVEASEAEGSERKRSKRITKYERRLKSIIPQEIINKFANKGYGVRYKTYRIANVEQNSAISELLRDGWEFVKSDELPEEFKSYYEVEDFRGRSEMLVAHDLVLMKHSLEYIQSEQDYYQELAKRDLDSVNTHVLQKKGFITDGSSSRVEMSEPDFAN
jgi:hypothetical protein